MYNEPALGGRAFRQKAFTTDRNTKYHNAEITNHSRTLRFLKYIKKIVYLIMRSIISFDNFSLNVSIREVSDVTHFVP
jgi:hypothetical protein